MRLTFDILSEPVDETYRQLLGQCAAYSSSVLMVVREPNRLTTSAQGLLEDLRPHLLREEKVSEWPGTILLKELAEVYRYHLNIAVLQRLQTAARALYQWVQPDLPEDLCLVRSDESPILVTIAHERDAYLVITEREAESLLVAIPYLKLHRRAQLDSRNLGTET